MSDIITKCGYDSKQKQVWFTVHQGSTLIAERWVHIPLFRWMLP